MKEIVAIEIGCRRRFRPCALRNWRKPGKARALPKRQPRMPLRIPIFRDCQTNGHAFKVESKLLRAQGCTRNTRGALVRRGAGAPHFYSPAQWIKPLEIFPSKTNARSGSCERSFFETRDRRGRLP